MRRQSLIGGLLVLFLLIQGCDRPEVPTFKGKPGNEWVRLLKDDDNATRLSAIEAVAAMPSVEGGKDGLRNVMRSDPLWGHRDAAALALWQHTSERTDVLATVQTWLNDADARMRWQAAVTLMKFGADAKTALPALQVVAKGDTSEWVRDKAGEAVKVIARGK